MITTFGSAPTPDTNEITTFGKGFGEAIVLHRRGEWFIFDSFYDESTGTQIPIATLYLDELGVPATAVKVVTATHWHDDHTAGISQLYERYSNSKFACAAALTTQEFLALAESTGVAYSGSLKQSRLAEWRKLLSTDDFSTRLLPVFAGTSIWRTREDDFELYALSPSGAEGLKMQQEIAKLLPQSGSQQLPLPKRGLPNHAAIAIVARFGNMCALLGSDLEISNISGCGWAGAISQFNNQIPTWKSFLYKIAHHGSVTAHDPSIWTHALEREPLSILTPFINGRVRLPTPTDVSRAKELSSLLMQASTQKIQQKTANSIAQTVLNRAGIKLQRYRASLGAVRVRWKDDIDDIDVQQFGSALER
ncbi:MBL fold metallo-hydrolase [Burkholderia gladioli]|uniref:MBL fold metallo-hydrolase n=1 Tax=Burkholderia gladioli TaxID=28095 RepID=UPI00163F2335|nr:MBL fold metallo-hydrolase [Burkholderia gladioli]